MVHHSVDVFDAEEIGRWPSSRRGLRMDFNAPPFDFQVEFLLQLFDEALADIAEGSDIVGKNFDADRH